MSLRQVLTIYNAERQLNEDDVALLNTLRRMNEGEIQFLVESLSGKSQKKARKKSVGGAGKSRVVQFCGKCGTPEDRPAHHDRASSDYHSFQPPSSKSKRATELGNTIRSRAQEKVVTTTDNDDDNSDGFCRHRFNEGNGHVCGLQQDHNVHHLENMVDHHEFQPAAAAAANTAGSGE